MFKEVKIYISRKIWLEVWRLGGEGGFVFFVLLAAEKGRSRGENI